jgi:hypothetical protein
MCTMDSAICSAAHYTVRIEAPTFFLYCERRYERRSRDVAMYPHLLSCCVSGGQILRPTSPLNSMRPLSSANASDNLSIDPPDPHSNSFVVKVWIEETDVEMSQVAWRGHITHVFSGKRRYLKDLNEITTFVAPYLQAMGVKLTRRTRLLSLLKRYLLSD